MLHRLRAEIPDGKLIVVWDGAPYHRAKTVWAEAASLGIELAPLPGYSPDLMPVEALWRWLREDVTYHHCHATADDLTRCVVAFEAQVNQDPCAAADRLWVKDHLDPEEEKRKRPAPTCRQRRLFCGAPDDSMSGVHGRWVTGSNSGRSMSTHVR